MQKILNPIIKDLEGVEAPASPQDPENKSKLSAKLAFQRHIGGVSGSEDKAKTWAIGVKLAELHDYVDEIILEDAELELLSKLIGNLRNPLYTDIVYAQMEKVLDAATHIDSTAK